MAADRLFVDTSFFLARYNSRDRLHARAKQLAKRLDQCDEAWTTQAIMLEIGAAFRRPVDRRIATTIWKNSRQNPRIHVATVNNELLDRGMDLFRARSDKEWSLADCVSFIVMADNQLTDALTCDHHFAQAGFRALLLEETA